MISIYRHLAYDERCQISVLLFIGKSCSEIAVPLIAGNGKEFVGHQRVSAGSDAGLLFRDAVSLLGTRPERSRQRPGPRAPFQEPDLFQTVLSCTRENG